MKTSEQTNEISSSLANAQSAIEGALKNSQNPFFKSTYANLEAVWEACRDALTKHKLSIVQGSLFTDHGWVLETRICHSSGQWIESEYPLKPVKDDPQGFGSAMTYARRYALAGMVGVHQSDDDANLASGKQPPHAIGEVKDVSSKPAPKPSTDSANGPHDHIWLTSRFKEKQEYCSICKSTRDLR